MVSVWNKYKPSCHMQLLFVVLLNLKHCVLLDFQHLIKRTYFFSYRGLSTLYRIVARDTHARNICWRDFREKGNTYISVGFTFRRAARALMWHMTFIKVICNEGSNSIPHRSNGAKSPPLFPMPDTTKGGSPQEKWTFVPLPLVKPQPIQWGFSSLHRINCKYKLENQSINQNQLRIPVWGFYVRHR